MKGRDEAKPQRINKQAAMHQRVAELEKLEFEHRQAEMAMQEACT
jgi:hypothetical protein